VVKSKNLSIAGYNYTDESAVSVEHAVHSISADITTGELVVNFDDGVRTSYTPIQLHLHSPSEHTILDKHYDLELHIVHKHKNSDKIGAVIAIFFDS